MHELDRTLDECLDRCASQGLRRAGALWLALVLLIAAAAVLAPRVQWTTPKNKKRNLVPAASPAAPAQPASVHDGR